MCYHKCWPYLFRGKINNQLNDLVYYKRACFTCSIQHFVILNVSYNITVCFLLWSCAGISKNLLKHRYNQGNCFIYEYIHSTIVSPTLCTAPGFIFPPSDLILIGNEKLPTTSICNVKPFCLFIIVFKQIHRFHAVLDNLDYQFDKIVCCLFQA